MREFYRLKGVLHYMRNHGLSLEEARAKVCGLKGCPAEWEIHISI
jgi:hypothetical protein